MKNLLRKQSSLTRTSAQASVPGMLEVKISVHPLKKTRYEMDLALVSTGVLNSFSVYSYKILIRFLDTRYFVN